MSARSRAALAPVGRNVITAQRNTSMFADVYHPLEEGIPWPELILLLSNADAAPEPLQQRFFSVCRWPQ
jgi:hypothetical protein